MIRKRKFLESTAQRKLTRVQSGIERKVFLSY
jgi:hypothetical protein